MRIADLLALRPERNAAFDAWAREHPAEKGRALFGSATLGPVLSLFTLHPGRSLTMAHVVYALGGNYESTHRALHRLVDAGILERHKRGRELLFTLRRDHPLLAPLRAACLQLCTVGPRLRWAREELGAAAIEVAFVFGSLATLEEDAESDVDLFVVGSVSLPALHRYLGGLGDEIERPVNPVCRTPEQIRARFDEAHSFYRSVWSRPRIPVIGTDEAVRAVVGLDAAA
jgi:predicted nucleotidyltransferase